MQSPIGLVPKDNGAKTRLIFHLSYDFKREANEKRNSVNYYTPSEVLESGILDEILNLEGGKPDKPMIYYSKTDVVSAFRVLPMKPSQRCWLIMMTKHPETGQILYFVDKCLPFGASISCAHFQAFSDVIAYIAERKSSQFWE